MMIRRFQQLVSLRNVRERRLGALGQVATYMLLLITAALIGTLALANLGQLAITSTNASNAADSSVLALASQLATKSNDLYTNALGGKLKKCKFGGYLAIILAVVVAIIVIVIAIFVPPVAALLVPIIAAVSTALTVSLTIATLIVFTVLGAIAGAIGGAIGGGIAGGWKGAAWGALQGAAIGAAIGGAAAGAYAPGLFAIEGAGTLGTAIGVTVTPALVTTAAYATAALVVASSLYNGYVADKVAADALKRMAKELNGLRERERMRESVFLAALTQTVDDPSMTSSPRTRPEDPQPEPTCLWSSPVKIIGDPDDVDGDGNTRESISCFAYWWYRRVNLLKQKLITGPKLIEQVKAFLNGPLRSISELTEAQYKRGGLLSRKEVEDSDGPIVKVARWLEVPSERDLRATTNTASYNVMFWNPKPNAQELQDYETNDNCDDEVCQGNPEPGGFDDLDALIEELKGLQILTKELSEAVPDEIMASVQSWKLFFYDPEDDSDYYDTMYSAIDKGKQIGTIARLSRWKSELMTRIRPSLPVCTYNWSNGNKVSAQNSPCRDGATFTTIDADLRNDEFDIAVRQINSYIAKIGPGVNPPVSSARGQWRAFYESMEGVTDESLGGLYGGPNPVKYIWTDSRGKHSVEVQVSNFRIARVKVKKGFTKTCTILKDYDDRDGSHTWVKITKSDPYGDNTKGKIGVGGDPSDPEAKGLWQWNPTRRGGVVVKMSHAQYGLNRDGKTWFVRLKSPP